MGLYRNELNRLERMKKRAYKEQGKFLDEKIVEKKNEKKIKEKEKKIKEREKWKKKLSFKTGKGQPKLRNHIQFLISKIKKK